MKTSHVLYFLLFLISCTEKPVQESSPETAASLSTIPPVATSATEGAAADEALAAKWQECLDYFESIRVEDSERVAYLDQLLQNKKSKLTENNRRFLIQLKADLTNTAAKKPRLTIEQALFAVFRIPDQKLGIIGHRVPDMERPSEYTDMSAEEALLHKWVGPQWAADSETRLVHFPELLDSIYSAGKPQIHLYTTKATRTSQIKELGHYRDECSEYYHYTFGEQSLQAGDEVLFASRLPLDLTYGSNPAFDEWYRTALMPECADCPSSHSQAITVAKLTGTENMYFVYADAFPDNRELHTPFRALVTKMGDGRTMYLWSSDIDNFGCSCL